MESPDIDYKIQKLHVNMSMCVLSKEEYAAELRDQKREKWEREQKVREHQKRGYSPQQTLEYFHFGRGGGGVPWRDENGRIVLAKDVPSGRQATINNHLTHEQAQLSPLRVERIHRQARQPHGEDHAIRSRATSMEERKTRMFQVAEWTKWRKNTKYRDERQDHATARKRMKAMEEARIREAERRKEGTTWGELKRKKQELRNEEEMEGMKKESEGAEVWEVGRE
ncbi:hypothetical protein BLNAU_14293 [Blattamonas nauphoetae]|uniref:Uncharacterized protein n=1 Tax=Blattamonas nauphoetae TaxID=2049346 RepID=A0ABQ9XGG2_9EUKA|nr:hypothetical protein BLNAU_14293 [Blattamonas nauphoetae]